MNSKRKITFNLLFALLISLSVSSILPIQAQQIDQPYLIESFPVGNYIIFYLPLSDGIEVVRVLHGRQDIDADDMR